VTSRIVAIAKGGSLFEINLDAFIRNISKGLGHLKRKLLRRLTLRGSIIGPALGVLLNSH
jgi:hypothetical protein